MDSKLTKEQKDYIDKLCELIKTKKTIVTDDMIFVHKDNINFCNCMKDKTNKRK